MSTGAETKPAIVHPPGNSLASSRWSGKKLVAFIVFALAVHLAFIFVLGAKHEVHQRTVTRVPQFEIANAADELIALEDPTLFALPHVEDFIPAIWRQTPDVHQPPLRWTEPPPFLPPAVENLGSAFNLFMASNPFAPLPLHFKPTPVLAIPPIPLVSELPEQSSLQIKGDISRRPLSQPVTVPTLKWNDVIAPSRVQVLVDAAGNVISAVLLPSASASENAGRAEIGDATALTLARKLHFQPGSGLTLGEVIFDWHTVPAPTLTNTP